MQLVRYLVPPAMVLAGLGLLRADDRKTGPVPGNPPRTQPAADADAIHRLQLQQWFDAQQAQIRAQSNLQAKHHETMMLIIGNLRPTGRYVYNPSTGRYDRYVTD